MRCKDIAQSTIVNWEKGVTSIPLDRLIAMSKLFQCDCGYLLCDYDQRTHNLVEISDETGLSEKSINRLSVLKTWGDDSEAKVIDLLLLDAQERYKSHHHRSILDLLSFFWEYDDGGTCKKQIFKNGTILDYNGGYISAHRGGYISTDAILLDARIVENAALMELQQALISLKKIYRERGEEEHG